MTSSTTFPIISLIHLLALIQHTWGLPRRNYLQLQCQVPAKYAYSFPFHRIDWCILFPKYRHTKKRRTTSKVWLDFDLEQHPGKDGVLEWKEVCKRCKSHLVGESKDGTGHLERHTTTHCKKDREAGLVQTTLQTNPDGTLQNFNYNPEVA
jgi:hypothetical protein